MSFRGRFESDDFNFEDELTVQRDERSSPIVILAAIAGLVVGLFVWGSVAMSVLSAGEATGTPTERAPVVAEDDENDAGDEVAIDCDDLAGASALSPAREARYREQCASPTPAAPEPAAAPAATPTPDTRPNRGDCNVIRGTAYNSPEERVWFLANCVAR
jgi:hypothetical protein